MIGNKLPFQPFWRFLVPLFEKGLVSAVSLKNEIMLVPLVLCTLATFSVIQAQQR